MANDFLGGFFNILIDPRDAFTKGLKKVDKEEATKQFALVGGLVGLIMGLAIAALAGLGTVLLGVFGLGKLAALATGLGLLSIIIFPILGAVFSVIGARISSWIFALASKWMGGKATYEQLYWLASLLIWPMLIANIVVNILAGIPVIGWVIGILWTLYGIYLTITMLGIANKFDNMKALITWIVAIIVLIVIAIIVALIVGVVVAVAIGSAAIAK